MKRIALTAALAVAAAFMVAGDAAAGSKSRRHGYSYGGYYGAYHHHHARSHYYKRGPQVRGYLARRGGYSYDISDSINTYGSARTVYGGSFYYRDPMLDRQTSSGPFDHGFFFDSGISPRGGDSPYMN